MVDITSKTVLGLVTFLIIGVLLLGAFAPMINSVHNTNSTTINNEVQINSGAGYTAPATYTLDGNDNYKFETAPGYANFVINGEKVNISQWDTVNQKIITDVCRVEFAGHYALLFDETGERLVNVNTSNKNVVFEYTASTKTFVATVYTDLTNTEIETQLTYSVNQILYADPHGTYGAIRYDLTPDAVWYVNDVSQVIAGGVYLTGDLDTSYFMDGETVYVGNASYTGSCSIPVTDDIKGVVKGDSVTVTITDGENTETFTPFTVYVPLSVKGYTENQSVVNTVLDMLPLVCGVGVLLGAVVYFLRRY